MRKQRFAISTFFHYTSMERKLPWQPEFLSDLNTKEDFWFAPPVDALSQISKVLASQLQRSRLKMLTDDERTPDAGYLPIL